MAEDNQYYVVRNKAVPDVLLKVVEAKRLLACERAFSVQEATERVGISRSSFYKYKDDIFPFHDNARGRTITFVMQMDDVPGLLSAVLKIIADYNGNILTINQTIPINGVASLTLSIDVLPITGDTSSMLESIERLEGIHYLKILGRE
ncbi:MAG: ACT domain-containing protein [Lachnospiraceae bacterium]|jgi:chorismate mutase|nr:ACT domain-containing protein [Lachnospiraceae bacterium]